MILRSFFRPSSILFLKSRNLQTFFVSHSTISVDRKNTRVGLKIRAVHRFNNRSKAGSMSSSSVVEQVVTENGARQVELLTSYEDDHGGIIVEMKEAMVSEVFVSLLRTSMLYWRQQGKKGIWIKLPIEFVNLVEPAVKEGFWYHHAEPKYLMLVYWIPETVNTLPVNATHRVGIGAFVMNDKREVLVVQEKNGKFRGTGMWKFPTGVVDEGEDICMGAIREVKEETGIDAEFVEVLAFRQSHKSFFDKSDLFFMCMLRPLSFNIEKQESEIEAAEWMPIDEYAAQPFVQQHGLLRYMINIGLAKVDKEYAGFSPVPTTSAFSNHPSYLYLNSHDLNRSLSSACDQYCCFLKDNLSFQFEQKSSGPGARSSHAITVVGQNAYVFGGEHTPRVPVDNKLHVLNLESLTWSVADATGDIPPPRVGVTMAAVGHTIYVFGGRDAAHNELNELYSFSTCTNKWTLLSSGDGPANRSYHSMTADDDCLYVFGGCGVDGRLNDLWAFDANNQMWVRFPSPGEKCRGRGGPGLAVSGGKIWVVYGFGGEELDDVHCFDPITGEWTQVETTGEKPTPRSVFSTVGIEGYIFIHGGEVDPSDLGHLGAGKFAREVFALDTETRVWKRWEDDLDSGDHHPGARGWCAFSGAQGDEKKGLLVYGGNSDSNDRLDDIFFFTPYFG
ncbi:hypothetical protein GIB67_001017 [Kingdonia uniflora]|uniref:Nudix hydrolase domain-containing protein n=1 Tax=Kingdonia uniflora TaxID=39325 RepID=A0A7J7MGA9_9MAGN|nr:hypothetical protein GIB67_001017 [Kingdonia uniflora]